MLFSPQILSRSQPRVVTASAYVGPGDIVSSAFAWWGLRGYTAAYSTGSNPALDLVDQAGANQLTVNILSGTTTASIAATDATWHAAQAVFNTTSSAAYVDGSSTTGLSVGTNNASGLAIQIGGVAVSNYFDGRYAEWGRFAEIDYCAVRTAISATAKSRLAKRS